MASARKIGEKWYYRITVVDDNGKKKYIERGSFETKEEAIEVGSQIEQRYKVGTLLDIKVPRTYKEMCEDWMSNYAENVYKVSTIHNHEKILRVHLYPYLDKLDPTKITVKQLQSIINAKIKEGHTYGGLVKIKATMKKSFDYGVRMGFFRDNPAKRVTLPAPRSKAAEELNESKVKRCIPKEEIKEIFERFPEGHPCHIPLLLGYRCGLRLGEVYALDIDDINFNKKTLTVRRQIQYNEKTNELYFTPLKYCLPNEQRVIALDNETLKVLHRQVNKILALAPLFNYATYYEDENHYIHEGIGEREIHFLNVRLNDGTYIAPRTMQHVGRVIHGKTGKFDCVDPLWDFHSLRHTHASECIEAGMNPVAVQHRMGHKRLETTYRYYIHLTEKEADEARSTIEMMFDPYYKPDKKVIKGHFKEAEVCAK